MQHMPKSKTQKTLTVQTNKEFQDTNRCMDFSSIGFHSQATKI